MLQEKGKAIKTLNFCDQKKLQRAVRQKEKEEREYQLEMDRLYHELKVKQIEEEHE